MKMSGVEAAKQFVSDHFPSCNIAILTGSTARGEDTAYSDLDIVIISDDAPAAYAEAYCEYGWMIEILMHNRDTYKQFFDRDCMRGRPSLPHMFASGIILVDDGTAEGIQLEARRLLDAGPPAWSEQEVRRARFAITNHLLDLQGGLPAGEAIFAGQELAHALHELVLRANRRWVSRGRRIPRALEEYDPVFAGRFAESFQAFYSSPHDASAVIRYADEVLAPYGGRLFEGYSTKPAVQP
ncbi:nucleotidyltransferase domain-containing protein [Paenibacillus mesophilus]|uniref:nucleotidyltransferase domain-containing protein n=1 Tax=Paenibacillus mesophilus TaxID=2582849 RepID=UPI00110F55F1|nr:nucleotidyltransferase domain-containing protein [Paenibacillus mesophilus]TMV52231.1 nucleotidyltransferase domain-containing protein [Paenibacillus mesophilus]